MQKLQVSLIFVIFFVTFFMINSTTYTFQCLDKKVIELWFWEYTSLHRDILCIKENDTKNWKSCFSHQNREFPILQISWKRYIFSKNECDFCNQHNIFVLEKLVTTGRWHENVKIHRVICPWLCEKCIFLLNLWFSL